MSSGTARSWRFAGALWLATALCLGSTLPARADPDPALAGVCVEQLRNGSFEEGFLLYWTRGGTPGITTGGHSGGWSAYLGGDNQDYDEISQVVACPFYSTRVIAHAYVLMSTTDWEEASDWLQLSAYGSEGGGGQSYYYNNNTAGQWWQWTFASVGAGACQPGATWTVRFRAETDAYLETSFRVDDVSVQVCCPDDAWEPNGNFSVARAVSPGTFDLWLCPSGDEEWFQFTAAAGQIIVADLTNPAALHGDLCLHRPDGSQLACSATPAAGAPEHLERVADQAGSWRARVFDPTGGTSAAAGQLAIQVRNQPPPTATRTATRTPTRTPTGAPTETRTPTATATRPGEPSRRLFLPLLLREHWRPRPEDCTELLVNGDLETGVLSPWGHIGDAGLGSGRESAHGGQLGGRNDASGELWQWVTIPADADAVPWETWWKAEAASAQPGDFLLVRLEADGDEPVFLTLRPEAPLNVWRRATVDLSPWAGRTVLAGYLVHTDGSVPTTFRVDDVTLRACRRP